VFITLEKIIPFSQEFLPFLTLSAVLQESTICAGNEMDQSQARIV